MGAYTSNGTNVRLIYFRDPKACMYGICAAEVGIVLHDALMSRSALV